MGIYQIGMITHILEVQEILKKFLSFSFYSNKFKNVKSCLLLLLNTWAYERA